jgi:hypothetical protein
MANIPDRTGSWHFSRCERGWLALSAFAILAFGVNLEQRTALRRSPMTDLGVFSCAAGAVLSGQDLYTITDWHGWHYQYPPALAILFIPLELPVPTPPAALGPGEVRTEANTPWGYGIANHRRFFGLHAENARFFCIVALWYLLSVALILLSAHVLACTLERCGLRDPPPAEGRERRRWWALRTLPLLICAGSLGGELSRGQVNVLMLAAIVFAIHLAASGRGFKAGFWLSLPAAVKIFPAILLVYPICRRQWRMLFGVMAGLVFAMALLPATALGLKHTRDMYQDWLEVLAKPALGQSKNTSRQQELTGMGSTDNQSLLAFVHNWHYYDLPRRQRPILADPVERNISYAVGGALLLAVLLAIGTRRPQTPCDALISVGLLVGASLVVSPVSHSEYYQLLMPLVAGLLYRALEAPARASKLKLLAVLAAFTLIDLGSRLPFPGPWLRELGLPLLSMVGLMAAGAMTLTARNAAKGTPVPTEPPTSEERRLGAEISGEV